MRQARARSVARLPSSVTAGLEVFRACARTTTGGKGKPTQPGRAALCVPYQYVAGPVMTQPASVGLTQKPRATSITCAR